MQLLLRGDAVCSEDGAQISRVLVRQAWGCAGTLGLLTNDGGGDGGSGSGSAGSSMAAGMIHGIAGMMMGTNAHHHQTTAKNKNEPTTTTTRHPSSNRSVKEDQSIALKILQTISMLVDSNSVKLTQDVLGSCILASLILGAGEKISSQQSHYSIITSSNNATQAAKDKCGSAVGGGAAGIVRRASFATLNQMLSNLFEKANDVIVGGKDDNPDISYMLLVAERTISDLCAFVGNHSSQNLQPNGLSGPFSAAAKEGLIPSPTTSLALLDMIFKQGREGVFQSIQSKQITEDQLSSFPYRLMSQACELVISILKVQHSRVYGPKISSDKHATDSSLEASYFCLFYFAVTISSSILLQQLPSVQSDNNATSMNMMSLEILKLLVSFVTGATDAYHESSDFEDGYIFNQTEREAFHIEQANSNGRGSVPSSRGAPISRLAQESAEPNISGSIISSEKLWRAFLSLDILNRLVSSCLEEIHLLDSINGQADSKDSSSIITVIAGAASDFATISASNREGILHVVMSAHNNETNAASASDIKESSSSERLSIDGHGNLNAAVALADKVTDASGVDSSDIPNCDAGETSWIAFKCILSMAKSLKLLSSENASAADTTIAEILSGSFVSTITLLQHYIKRMCGSHVIVSCTLAAYEELAYASMIMEDKPGNLRRQAILTSLCKLCLPKWGGKKRANCQLKESNIDALWTMLWLIHSHFEKIVDEWDVIISTFDQLGSVSISSMKLSTAYSEKAAAIAKCFIRLPKFTTCFSSNALYQFTSSLVKLSEAVSFEPMTSPNTNYLRKTSESSYGDIIDTQPSIGGKLMNFAGRAFGGSQQLNPNTSFRKIASSGTAQMSKSYSEDLRETTCLHLASMKISTPSSVIRKLPLPLLLLVVVAEANMYRFSIIEESVAVHFCELVAKSPDEEVRSFAMEALIRFMPPSLSKSEIGLKFGTRPVMIPDEMSVNDTPLGVTPIDSIEGYEDYDQSEKKISSDSGSESELQVLKILCRTIQSSAQVDTAETGLKALHVVLEGSVHSLSGGDLVTIVRTLSLLSGYNSLQNNEATSIDRSVKAWANVSAHSFQTFKLIFDEYLESLPVSSEVADSETRVAMIDCCVAFGRSHHDVNTALTATGMLWSLADRDSSSETLDIVLSNLALLSSDSRPELRNCSVNTLFSCVVGLGERFTEDQWKKSLNDTIFGVMKEIASGINGAEDTGVTEDASKDRYKVAVHHTRNSASKQWAATQVLAVRGLERVLRQYFLRLLSTASSISQNSRGSQQPWIIATWKEILAISLDCSKLVGGRETLDVRLAGAELILLCAQLSCKAGIVAAGTTARVGTNMEVVGGALRSVRTPTRDKLKRNETSAPTLHMDDALRQQLFELAFATVDEFRKHLEEIGAENSYDYSGVDSLLMQVLTKIMGELAKLYECCKNDEMSPGVCALQLDIIIENDNGYESRFLYLLKVITNTAKDDGSFRYLNQAQRGVMSLLQSMASNSSLRAFELLRQHPVIDTGVTEDASKDRYKVAVHHTRNSASKQWAATQVLAVRGLERVLRQYFLRLLSTASSISQNSRGSQQPWIIATWKEILAISLDCSKLVGGRETLDVRLAGAELILLCAQLSCKAGIVAAGTTARVGTNMEVVGGALRSVRTPTRDKLKRNETSAPTLHMDDALRQQLFELAFATVDEFRKHLEEIGAENSYDYSGVDSLLMQVLTKIMGELAKLYECCKNDEMSPGVCALQLDIIIENDNGYESRFLYLLKVITNTAKDDGSFRYLNQAQRGVMSLLQSMASNSSLRAFEALTTASGDYMFVRSNDKEGESFELEAAKTVASAFDSDNLSAEAKVAVMCSVLSHYLQIYGSDKEAIPSDSAERKTSEARYDIVTKVIDSGLNAAANIDATADDKAILDSIWERIVTVVSSLILPPAASRYDGYAHHSKSILDIVAKVLTHLPPRKYASAEPMLEQGANRAVEVAFECIEDINKPDAAEGAVHVFLACFMGLCQKMPTCSAVTSLTNRILGDAIDSEEEDGSVLFSKTQQSLAIAVCESLQTTTSQDLLVGVFPLLCRLTNVENDGLRRVAGRILGGVNLAQSISRERQRAEEADLRVQEVDEENSAMLEEIEYLQAENEELQRQLALFITEADT